MCATIQYDSYYMKYNYIYLLLDLSNAMVIIEDMLLTINPIYINIYFNIIIYSISTFVSEIYIYISGY